MPGRKAGFKGYWADHELEKGNVYRDVDEWIGWEKLGDMVGQIEQSRDKNILRAIFLTGGRVSEVIRLKPGMFSEADENGLIRVMGAPLEKNKTLSERRPFYIKRDEPLMESLHEWIRGSNKWLFPSGLGKDPFVTRGWAWQVVNEATNRYPHFFRALRATQLVYEYGLTYEDLIVWFTWQNVGTAMHYSKGDPRKIAEKML